MKSLMNVGITLFISLMSPIVFADLPATDTQKLTPDEQKAAEYVGTIGRLGYIDIIPKSFTDTNSNMSATMLKRNKRNSPPSEHISYAVIDKAPGSTRLFFMFETQCTASKWHPSAIYVDGQKIAVSESCKVKDNIQNAKYYFTTSDAGQKFIYQRFLDKGVVYVRFEDIEIPFATAGFKHEWDDLSKPAL